MIYLTGAIRRGTLGHDRLGIMVTPNMWNRVDLTNSPWAADNGRFSRPEKFSMDRYLAWLQKMARFLPTNLFAVAPDVVGDPEVTWELSAPALPQLRHLGYRAALVGQDGVECMPIAWDAFDVFFIGGVDCEVCVLRKQGVAGILGRCLCWKLSPVVAGLVAEAKRRGKWVHMGRVNSYRRLIAAQVMGCDSADGTHITYGPDIRLPQVMRWLQAIAHQPPLALQWNTEQRNSA